MSSSLSSGVSVIYSSAFAALKTDGSVVTWGFSPGGGDSSSVNSLLSSGVSIVFLINCILRSTEDGRVLVWALGQSYSTHTCSEGSLEWACSLCPEGHYAEGIIEIAPVTLCPEGQYAEGTGNSACSLCPVHLC